MVHFLETNPTPEEIDAWEAEHGNLGGESIQSLARDSAAGYGYAGRFPPGFFAEIATDETLATAITEASIAQQLEAERPKMSSTPKEATTPGTFPMTPGTSTQKSGKAPETRTKEEIELADLRKQILDLMDKLDNAVTPAPNNRPEHKPVYSSLPEPFDGTPGTYETWRHAMTKWVEDNDDLGRLPSSRMTASIVIGNLRKDPAYYMQHMDYPDFDNALYRRETTTQGVLTFTDAQAAWRWVQMELAPLYLDKAEKIQATKQLFRTRQGNDSFQEYYIKFEVCRSKTDYEWTNRATMDIFIRGMEKELREEVLLRCGTTEPTIANIREAATLISTIRGKRTKEEPRKTGWKKYGGRQAGVTPGEVPALKSGWEERLTTSGKYKDTENNEWKTTYTRRLDQADFELVRAANVCSKCFQEGHYAPDCREIPRLMTEGQRNRLARIAARSESLGLPSGSPTPASSRAPSVAPSPGAGPSPRRSGRERRPSRRLREAQGQEAQIEELSDSDESAIEAPAATAYPAPRRPRWRPGTKAFGDGMRAQQQKGILDYFRKGTGLAGTISEDRKDC